MSVDLLQSAGYEYADGQAAAVSVAERLAKGDGIFCPADTLAFGLIDTLKTRYGLAVPETVSVIGYDGTDYGAWDHFRLTTIEQPVEPFVDELVDLLNARIAAPESEPQNRVVDVQLISRESVQRQAIARGSAGGAGLRTLPSATKPAAIPER